MQYNGRVSLGEGGRAGKVLMGGKWDVFMGQYSVMESLMMIYNSNLTFLLCN